MKWWLFYILCFATATVMTQNTIGVVEFDSRTVGGFTLFSPFSGTKAYLVDECGRIINSWDRGTRPGLSAYFLETGLLFRTFKVSPQGPFTSASNAGGLELVNWENETVWTYEINTPTRLSHHDAVYMPNGNILVLTWELVFTGELIELGRDPSQIAVEGFMWSENIWELTPSGDSNAELVWEWKIKDHYIQDFDRSKANFGVVADHPELFDINLPDLNSSNSNATRDWNHFNSIDYNADLDQILISTRNSDEIWIIDHSTSSEEAAGHSGGRYGRGGDLLYRWGNAHAYRQAAVADQKLFGQHGAQWITDEDGQESIILFNNGNGRFGQDKSTVEIIRPPMTADGNYLFTPPIGPAEADIIYGDQPTETFYSPFLSNAQRLQNGHFLINAGSIGQIFEIGLDREVLWRYIIPLAGDFPIAQGGSTNNNWTFRAYRYPADFAGFASLDVSPADPIEMNPNLEFCTTTSAPDHALEEYQIGQDQYSIRFTKRSRDLWRIQICNVQGQIINQQRFQDEVAIQVPQEGVYFITIIKNGQPMGSHKFIFLP